MATLVLGAAGTAVGAVWQPRQDQGNVRRPSIPEPSTAAIPASPLRGALTEPVQVLHRRLVARVSDGGT